MKKVITYGTFDLMHHGHISILKRAKALGDYLIVGVTTEAYDQERGKLNVQDTLMERIENVRATGLADKIIVEEYEGQKILDIQKYHVDIFVIGSDWMNKFDYLKEYCDVVYMERTKGISSTKLRQKGKELVTIGIIGNGRIAERFVKESKYVSGLNIEGVYNPHLSSAQAFAEKEELRFYSDSLQEFLEQVNAVYIASPHGTHYGYICQALDAGKDVLCEKPMTLSGQEAEHAYELAAKQECVLMEAIKTAYCPAFEHLQILAKSGQIGEIVDIDATFTKIVDNHTREKDPNMDGGSFFELGSYPLLPIIRLLGTNYEKIDFYSVMSNKIDEFTRAVISYGNKTASLKVGIGAKSEGEMIITGRKGYLYVPAPWWKTEYFEMRFEDPRSNIKFFYRFEGDGLRYEMVDFINTIHRKKKECLKLRQKESIAIAQIMEQFRLQKKK